MKRNDKYESIVFIICHFRCRIGVFTRSVSARENLIINGSFENGLMGWNNSFPEKLQIMDDQGNHFLRFTMGKGAGPVTSQIVTDLKPNSLYTLTWDSRATNTHPPFPAIDAVVGLRTIDGISVFPTPLSQVFVSQKVQLKSSNTGTLNVFISVEPEMGMLILIISC
jgi:hypothetical protein